MKSCKTCVFALDYEFSPACEKCFHHSNWLEKVKTESIPMTNGDRIRSMSNVELYHFLCDNMKCECCNFQDWAGCRLAIWLAEPHKENTDG